MQRLVAPKRPLAIAMLSLFLTACLFLCGCAAKQSALQSVDFFAMDTVMRLTAYGKNARLGLVAAEAEVLRLDALLSVTNPDGEIYRINAEGSAVLSDETAALVGEAVGISGLTGGAFDVTVYPLVKAWGFFSGEYAVPEKEELEKLLRLVGSDKLAFEGNKLTFRMPGMGIDLGGIAKGYASDRVAAVLAESGVTCALVSLGGNIKVLGTNPQGQSWRIAIRDPQDESAYAGIVQVVDKAVVTSGGYERCFEQGGKRYHHILDPENGMPANGGLLSVTIVCESGMLADALSTALFVMGEADACAFWRAHVETFDAVLVTSDGRTLVTAGIADDFSARHDFEVVR